MARDDGRVRVAERLVQEWDTACRIAPVEVHVNALRGLLTALATAEAERDEQRKDTEAWYRQSQVLSAECDRLEQRATRLWVLEQAARALMDCTGGIVCQWGTVGMGAWRDLQEAVANLAAPPGDV